MSRRLTVVIALSMGVIAAAVAAQRWNQSLPPGFVRQLPWAGGGQWLRADLHAHTRFSDGAHTVDDVVDKARQFGCDVVAITDHADSDLTAATPEYHAAIAAARARVPEVTILTGLEWNIPPGKGNDHATVLFPPAMADDQRALAAFKETFDDLHRKGENPELADDGLDWLATRTSGNQRPLVVLNHPSRRVAESADVLPSLRRWRKRYAGFIGFEGAPGHQFQEPLGAYGGAVKLVDRWDPVTASVGGVWDTLLAEGLDVWGSLASSDFHSPGNGDYWPCEFSATHIYARDRSAEAVLEALSVGSFFGAHGRVVEGASLTVGASDLPREALPGEAVRLPVGAELVVTIDARPGRGSTEHGSGRLHRLEIITTSLAGTTVAAEQSGDAPRATARLTVPAQRMALRARGCSARPDGPASCFYTNPVVVIATRQ